MQTAGKCSQLQKRKQHVYAVHSKLFGWHFIIERRTCKKANPERLEKVVCSYFHLCQS